MWTLLTSWFLCACRADPHPEQSGTQGGINNSKEKQKTLQLITFGPGNITALLEFKMFPNVYFSICVCHKTQSILLPQNGNLIKKCQSYRVHTVRVAQCFNMSYLLIFILTDQGLFESWQNVFQVMNLNIS